MKELFTNPKKLEVMGLALILIAAAWQFFLEGAIQSIANAGRPVLLGEMLADIWLAQAGDTDRYVADNTGRFFDTKERLRADYGLQAYGLVRALLFLFGSITVIVAKWRMAEQH